MTRHQPRNRQASNQWILKGLLLICLILLAVVFYGLAIRKPDGSPPQAVTRQAVRASENKTLSPTVTLSRAGRDPIPLPPQANTDPESKTPRQSLPERDHFPLEKILLAPESEGAKAQQLLALMPSLAESEQEETAQHLVNLLEDGNFSTVTALLTNIRTSTNVLDILVSDLLNRPNSIKLPLLLQVMRNQEHPKETEAREILLHFLEADYGSDWGRWETALRDWLDSHPD
ncbi:MAG TPA: hypothetical protein P5186_08950 [Candidatus Paceibacterota bacterium]|nr:hypothetical protein [Verrucomicrobiota bacterium]HRY48161.1 hypothetical protein [Candidatus Paceibacterota bacterium]HSA02052.1 hypothetical protein [Candidatus Paceibacterota bacterium]